jgi:lipoate-protein ligase A
LNGPGGPWRVERQNGSARRLLDGSLAAARSSDGPARLARILGVDEPALVLGSGQPESDVDLGAAAAAGVTVVRRSSGGGAVLVEAGAVLWIDLIVPVGDPLWDADVRRGAWWVGEAWAAALDRAGAGRADVWRGGLHSSAWSGRVCFAGLGPGEVTIGPRKVVGISQRRTRQAALFQTAALLHWDPASLLALLRIDESVRPDAVLAIEERAVGVGRERAGGLADALLAALPGPSAGPR